MYSKELNKIRKELKRAKSYEEWKGFAVAHDKASGMEAWKEVNHSDLYDNDEIYLRLETIRAYREQGDDQGLLFALNEGVHGNMGGMGNPNLYSKALFGTKQLIEDYVEELVSGINHIADKENKNISFEDKLDFFRRASHCFGRSALMLSGGGQLGNFHAGVLKVLAKHHLIPSVVSGSSVGSIFAALAGTHSDKELMDFLENDRMLEIIEKEATIFKNIAEKRSSLSIKDLESVIKNIIPNLTFQEAFEKTGRKINISVSPHGGQQKSRLLNAIASPNVLIRSALMASCAVPGVFPPVTLFAKNKEGKMQAYLPSRKWIDGSMSNDLPSKRLARLFGVNHFIISLTNPLVLPFVNTPFQRSELLAPLVRFGTAVIKETTQFNYTIAKRFFKYIPSLALLANTINSVVQQDYQGDINIMADFSVIKPNKLLSALTRKELTELIKKGEKATWPKLEAIRICTKVGRTLDKILEEYELEEMRLANRFLTIN
jgi:TAG lipase/steryl ester hydrolase/phospholipase A2/LPA acyltransferase